MLENLGELGYLDDEAFAVNRARHLAVNRLYGDRKIEEQLREKGIAREAAKAAIREVREEFPAMEGIARSAAKKLQGRGIDGLSKKERLALARTLQGKGYHLWKKLAERDFTNPPSNECLKISTSWGISTTRPLP